MVRHLYHKQLSDIINIPSGVILFNLHWARSENPTV